jgi:hypothetical protein
MSGFPVLCTIGDVLICINIVKVGNLFVVDMNKEEFHSVENVYIVCFNE